MPCLSEFEIRTWQSGINPIQWKRITLTIQQQHFFSVLHLVPESCCVGTEPDCEPPAKVRPPTRVWSCSLSTNIGLKNDVCERVFGNAYVDISINRCWGWGLDGMPTPREGTGAASCSTSGVTKCAACQYYQGFGWNQSVVLANSDMFRKLHSLSLCPVWSVIWIGVSSPVLPTHGWIASTACCWFGGKVRIEPAIDWCTSFNNFWYLLDLYSHHAYRRREMRRLFGVDDGLGWG